MIAADMGNRPTLAAAYERRLEALRAKKKQAAEATDGNVVPFPGSKPRTPR